MLQRHLLILTFASWAASAHAQAQVERNVVYGMFSGTALLMDVHRPERSNGFGIVAIHGSGWSAPLGYRSPLLNRAFAPDMGLAPLVDAGYTVFVVAHRALPRFVFPAPLEDAQRAVRFIRSNAATYGIDSLAIGAIGTSSGGHLVSMLGVLDGTGDPTDADEVNRRSSKVQAVVAISAPLDLKAINTPVGGATVAEFLGVAVQVPPTFAAGTPEGRRYTAASPVTHVSRDDPPFLLIHGDADPIVPFQQSQVMESALRNAGVTVTMVPIGGGGHGGFFQLNQNDPRMSAFNKQVVEWFDTHIRRAVR